MSAIYQQGASEFVFARLRHDSGDWDYNPKVAANVLNSLVEYTTIPVYRDEVIIPADSAELPAFPFLFMTGHLLVRSSQPERDGLARYVERNKDYGCDWDYDWRNKRFRRDDNTRFGVHLAVYAMTS